MEKRLRGMRLIDERENVDALQFIGKREEVDRNSLEIPCLVSSDLHKRHNNLVRRDEGGREVFWHATERRNKRVIGRR